jgi:hypothetical protein
MDGPGGSHSEWSGLRLRSAAFVYLFGQDLARAFAPGSQFRTGVVTCVVIVRALHAD